VVDKVPTVGVVFNPILDEVQTSDMQYVGCTCKNFCQTDDQVSQNVLRFLEFGVIVVICG
jgi:hypothetical protein